MVVICNIYKNVRDLLPHFFRHYMGYGVNEFLFGIHSGKDNPVWKEIHELIPSGAVAYLSESYRGPICGTKEGESLNRLRTWARPGWVIPTDLDEFHIPCDFSSFQQLEEACKAENAYYVSSTLCDYITPDGAIPPTIDPTIPISEQFPTNVNLTKNLLKALDRKVCLCHKRVPLMQGHHNPGNERTFDANLKAFSKTATTRHYKWFGNLWEKEEEKYRSYKELGYDYCEENRVLLEHLRSHNGKLL